MKGKATCYEEIYSFCQTIPIVDCHDHSIKLGPRYTDPIQVVIGEYLLSDLASVTSEAEAQTLLNSEIPWEDCWPLLEKAWKCSCHTGYAQITRRVLKKFYGEADVALAALRRMQDRLINLEDEAVFEGILEDAKIVVRLANVWPDVKTVLDGSYRLTPPPVW